MSPATVSRYGMYETALAVFEDARATAAVYEKVSQQHARQLPHAASVTVRTLGTELGQVQKRRVCANPGRWLSSYAPPVAL